MDAGHRRYPGDCYVRSTCAFFGLVLDFPSQVLNCHGIWNSEVEERRAIQLEERAETRCPILRNTGYWQDAVSSDAVLLDSQ